MSPLASPLLACILLAVPALAVPALAAPASAARIGIPRHATTIPVVGSDEPAGPAIARAVQTFIDTTSPDAGKVLVTKLDVQGSWALATITTPGKDLDDAFVLLRKQRGTWRALVLGTALYGTGRTYGVPKPLRRRWGL